MLLAKPDRSVKTSTVRTRMLRHFIKMGRHFRRLTLDQSGATAIEYALMVALISLTIFGAINAVGQGIRDTLYGQIVTALQNMSR
jgi:Flp pilus assembly pilin Flp